MAGVQQNASINSFNAATASTMKTPSSLKDLSDKYKDGQPPESVYSTKPDYSIKNMAAVADTSTQLRDTIQNNSIDSLTPSKQTQSAAKNTNNQGSNGSTSISNVSSSPTTVNNPAGSQPLIDSSISDYIDKLFSLSPTVFQHQVENFAVGQSSMFV